MTTTHKQLLLAIPLFALVVYAVCRLLSGGDAAAPDPRTLLGELSPEEMQNGGSIRFCIDFPAERPASGTIVLSPEAPEGYPRPANSEGCTIAIATDSGKLFATIPQTPGTEYSVTQLCLTPRRQPDGSVHPLRQILLRCKTQAQSGVPVEYLLQLEVDTIAHTADVTDCTAWPQLQGERHMRQYSSLAPTGLPEKHSGSYIQRRLSRFVHALAAIDTPESAQKYGRALREYAWELAHEAPYPVQPWPRCWGEHADDARAAAGLITPTLLFLKENNCLDSADLAALINSAPFGIIFGDRFTAHPDERMQEEHIHFIPVPAAHE